MYGEDLINLSLQNNYDSGSYASQVKRCKDLLLLYESGNSVSTDLFESAYSLGISSVDKNGFNDPEVQEKITSLTLSIFQTYLFEFVEQNYDNSTFYLPQDVAIKVAQNLSLTFSATQLIKILYLAGFSAGFLSKFSFDQLQEQSPQLLINFIERPKVMEIRNEILNSIRQNPSFLTNLLLGKIEEVSSITELTEIEKSLSCSVLGKYVITRVEPVVIGKKRTKKVVKNGNLFSVWSLEYEDPNAPLAKSIIGNPDAPNSEIFQLASRIGFVKLTNIILNRDLSEGNIPEDIVNLLDEFLLFSFKENLVSNKSGLYEKFCFYSSLINIFEDINLPNDDLKVSLVKTLFQAENSKDIYDSIFTIKELKKYILDFSSYESEIKDIPTKKELGQFLLNILIATTITLPNIESSGDRFTDVKRSLKSLMEWWGASNYSLENLENIDEELSNALTLGKNNEVILNCSMFTCLYGQIARLAKSTPEEKSKYVTLNPLRSDFPSFLPYLIMLKRILKKQEVGLDVYLLIGNTDDQDTFITDELYKKVFDTNTLIESQKRQIQVSKRMEDLSLVTKVKIYPKLYSSFREVSQRRKFINSYLSFLDNNLNPYLQARVDQWVKMFEDQSAKNIEFRDLVSKYQSLCAKAFASMYVMQGLDLEIQRENGQFIIDTIAPPNGSIYCTDKKGLRYPPTNIFPVNRGDLTKLLK